MEKEIIPPHLIKIPWINSNFKIETLHPIGKGGFAHVLSAEDINSNEVFAIKILDTDPDDDNSTMINEITTISKLGKSPNIVSLKDFYIDTKVRRVMFSMEKATGDLRKYLKENGKKLHPKLILQMALDCLSALIYANEIEHQKEGFAHMDIKPANILYFKVVSRENIANLQNICVFDKTIVFKLTDWGAAMTRPNTTRVVKAVSGTMSYSAPEIRDLKTGIVKLQKADVFSLGMTMLQCCGVKLNDFKQLSAHSKSQKFYRDLDDLLDEVKNAEYDEIKKLLKEILVYDFQTRMTLIELQKRIIDGVILKFKMLSLLFSYLARTIS